MNKSVNYKQVNSRSVNLGQDRAKKFPTLAGNTLSRKKIKISTAKILFKKYHCFIYVKR